MRLLLVRHGETDWNASGRIQGATDIPLNDTGRRQALKLQRRLAAVAVHAAYTSDLSRCVETARIVLDGQRRPVRRDVRLRSTRCGSSHTANGRAQPATSWRRTATALG